MRKQYHFRPSPNGLFAWDVHRLIELTTALTPQEVSLDEIAEIDENYWFLAGDVEPTGRIIAEHFKLMMETDLRHPIILCLNGRVMDGMHRILRALHENKTHIKCVRFLKDPEPDYTDIQPDELPY
ncbi:MAG: hypothetical protein COB78_04840 [Hyphomicrobiales bacterium]|nr:MAG: hypothetical protein COB78_04840 [Hyphomicrobiales bacterium]